MPEETLRDSIGKAIEKSAPVVEAPPVVEAKPVVEEKTVVEAKPVVEEKPVVEAKPVVEEKTVVEAKPAKVEIPTKGIRAPESWKPAIREAHWRSEERRVGKE